MGWLSYNATNYKDNGSVDRKAELDGKFVGGYTVLRSSMVGSTYYAAVREAETGRVQAVVCLTSVDNSDWGYNFSYKDMTESMGPNACDCPIGILNLLTDTENEYALEWRERCRKRARDKRTLRSLPVGSRIRLLCDGTVLTKRDPSYQFSTPWWEDVEHHCYVSKKRIPVLGFEVVS